MRFVPELQEWFSINNTINVIHHVNKMMDKNHMIISTDAGKALDKIQHPFMIKTLKVGVPQHNKAIYDKPTLDIIFNGDKLKAFPLRSRKRQECPLLSLLFNIVSDILARAVRQKKK